MGQPDQISAQNKSLAFNGKKNAGSLGTDIPVSWQSNCSMAATFTQHTFLQKHPTVFKRQAYDSKFTKKSLQLKRSTANSSLHKNCKICYNIQFSKSTHSSEITAASPRLLKNSIRTTKALPVRHRYTRVTTTYHLRWLNAKHIARIKIGPLWTVSWKGLHHAEIPE